MNNILIMIKKELRSIFRDKKTLITILLFPFIIPGMIFLYSYLMDMETKTEDYTVAINYEIDTTESSLLTECNLKTEKYDTLESMEEAYKNGTVDAYITYDSESNKYIISTNTDSMDGMKVESYILSYFESYNKYLGNIKLLEEDIEPDEIYNNINYEINDLEGENYIIDMIYSICFTYIIEAIVLACTNMATSATALEKENGTLETLLTFPIKSNELIVGKYLAAFFLGFISALISFILTMVSLILAVNFSSLFKNVTVTINPLTIIVGLVICISASIFISGLSIALTSLSKSYKEAQSASSLLNTISLIPMFVSMLNVQMSPVYYIIPIANYIQLLMDIFSNNGTILNTLLVLSSSIVYAVIVIFLIIKQYKSEKILFGR